MSYDIILENDDYQILRYYMDVLKILNNWGILSAEILQQFGVGGSRCVYKIQTEIGTIILKGQPIDSKEEFILGNIHAHEFLGNMYHMAPKIYYRPDGTAFWKNDDHYYYLMEFIEGRQAQETIKDEKLLGVASAKLHQLPGYLEHSTFDVNATIEKVKQWFSEYPWKNEFDELIAALPDFSQYNQCFIHTDIGPHNTIIRDGSIVFIDLDDAGLGSQFIDLGWPFIMQFVDYNKQTHEMKYRFDLAKAFLEGYISVIDISKNEYDLLWQGAIFMHISYMKCFGQEAEQSLWNILKFGIKQKAELFAMLNETKK